MYVIIMWECMSFMCFDRTSAFGDKKPSGKLVVFIECESEFIKMLLWGEGKQEVQLGTGRYTDRFGATGGHGEY